MNLGPTELLIILALVVVLFGASKLPRLARSVGEVGHEFRRGVQSDSTATEPTATES